MPVGRGFYHEEHEAREEEPSETLKFQGSNFFVRFVTFVVEYLYRGARFG
jgi:hypothetical protein